MKKRNVLFIASCLFCGMIVFNGCHKVSIEPHISDEDNPKLSMLKSGSIFTVTSVATSSSLWPASALNDGDVSTLWSSNTHSDPNTTEWVAFWFSSFNNVNYIKLYPRYYSNVANGFPVNFDIYWSDGSNWVFANSYVSYPNPQSGWVVFPLNTMVNTNGFKVVATRLGVDINNTPVFQLGEVSAGSCENRVVSIDDPIYGPPIHSTYSPWVMHETGWDRYRMYFGRNEIINSVSADRIYLSENVGDGMTGWGTPMVLLSPGGTGQGALIHDPTVTIVGSTWHMYYTGTDGPDGNGHYNNRVFHATSSDGVSWTKQGQTSISGLPAQNGTYGCGEPSIFYEGGTYYLYFFSDTAPTTGTVCLATGTNGSNFTYYGIVSNMIVSSPEVRKKGSDYILVGSSSHINILKQSSTNKTSFGSSYTQIYTIGELGTWDHYHVGHPDFLPDENRLYYSGTNNNWLGSSEMDDGKIGVGTITF